MVLTNLLIGFVMTFTAALVVCLLATWLWDLVLHGQPIADWETTFQPAIISGIALPVV